jgi:hypothetical protein
MEGKPPWAVLGSCLRLIPRLTIRENAASLRFAFQIEATCCTEDAATRECSGEPVPLAKQGWLRH